MSEENDSCPPHCCCCGPGEPCCDCGKIMPKPDLSASEFVIAALWQDVLDKDDRTSPPEYPDMALITFEEFKANCLYFGMEVHNRARDEIINSPETADFMAAVPLEAAHARERWGSDHDAGKSPWDWFWLVGYLVQKAAAAHVAGDLEKAKHHTISTAAALANWHARLSGSDDGRFAPGLSEEPKEKPLDLDNLPLGTALSKPFP